jgi:uncharacterized protein (TIGR02246 family)
MSVDAFVAAINAHNVDRICELMTDDHVFIDMLGNEQRGRETMRANWTKFFQRFPDYWIKVESRMAMQETNVLTGRCGATRDGKPWDLPAAWRAVVRDGRIAEWRVYADNSLFFNIFGIGS